MEEDMKRLVDKIDEIERNGCGIGKVHQAQLEMQENKACELDRKFWWLITMTFVTLIGVAFNLAVSYTQLQMKEPVKAQYEQKYPIP